jgi:hypothetical protein
VTKTTPRKKKPAPPSGPGLKAVIAGVQAALAPQRTIVEAIELARATGTVPSALLAPLELGGTPEMGFARMVEAIEQAKALVRETGKPHNIIKTMNGRLWTLPVPPFGEEKLVCVVTVADAERTR